MLDTRRSIWTTLRRKPARRRPRNSSPVHLSYADSVAAVVVPLRSIPATQAADGVDAIGDDRYLAPASKRLSPLAALNPADALSRMLPH